MSRLLWKFYLEDDVESFCQLLGESAISSTRQPGQRSFTPGQASLRIGSPGSFTNSPSAFSRSGDDLHLPSTPRTAKAGFHDVVLTRADVNRKDGKGMTLLHYAASSVMENAKAFALALIAHPLIDLFLQDSENGWTSLHRSFYFGNITIARAILEKEAQDRMTRGQNGSPAHDTSLIRVKDREGNGPIDLLTATIKDRTLQHQDMGANFQGTDVEAEIEVDNDGPGEEAAGGADPANQPGLINLHGDELFTFGSNKNITLGLGNEDDRQFPERAYLKRPEHLYRRFHREHLEAQAARHLETSQQYADKILQHETNSIPACIRARPIVIRDVQMSKFHSAVLTSDPISNLHVCGHGQGGRLGTGNEQTQFNFVCVEEPAFSRKKIIAVALGQDHTLAVTDQGELFTWGSNMYGQLGTGMSRTSLKAEEPNQLLPKQIFGSLKKEVIVGAAASRIHSVVNTAAGLFTFGKNEGQLGIIDAHAGTLEIQPTPRRVAASRFSCGFQSVSAIDRATVCLLENHEVHVFANYGVVKLQFPLDGFSNYFLKDNFRSTRYDEKPNTIVKVTCGGDTICALSSSGEIFAVSVDQRLDPAVSGSASTTNPNKIRAALSTPSRIWTLKKRHMNARDVGVDQDGSIVLTTEAGSVWRRVRRINLPGARAKGGADRKSKDFKFSRVPGLTRVIAVRASASGAYSAIRRDCDVTRTQIVVNRKTLWTDVGALLPFKNIATLDEANVESPNPSFWTRPTFTQKIIACLVGSKDLEKDIEYILTHRSNEKCLSYDAAVATSVSDVQIPVHSFMLGCRSRPLRSLMALQRRGGVVENETLTLTVSEQGKLLFRFKGLDFIALIELVLYTYTDELAGFWQRPKQAANLAFRHRQVRMELMKLASRLDLPNLESAARRMTAVSQSMNLDFEMAFADFDYLQNGDTLLQLKDGKILVHSDLLSRRCPFFEGLFQGRAGGQWLAGRRELQSDPQDSIGIDFTHVESSTFRLVVRHIYADTGDELFDDIVTEDLDEFLDIVLEVLGVANELMLDGLSQICQKVIGRYVNTKNVCGLLNATAPSVVPEFKTSALEYTCLNLEAMLTSQYLDELEDDLLHELDGVVRGNQLATLPFAKSGRAEADLLERHPELAAMIDRDRQAKLDALNLQMKYADHQGAFGIAVNGQDDDDFQARAKQRRRRLGNPLSPEITALEPKSLNNRAAGSPIQGVTGTAASPVPSSSLSTSFNVAQTDLFPRLTAGTLGQMADLGPSMLSSAMSAARTGGEKQPIEVNSRPWDAGSLAPTKLGMKEIMDQASSSKPSGISMGLASQNKSDFRSAGSFNSRVSQKERRRLLQQQQEQKQQQPAHDFESKSWISSTGSSPTPMSPWQTVSKSKSSVTIDPFSANAKTMKAESSSQRTPTPQLTMRQTVANVPASAKGKEKTDQPPQTPINKRSVSTTPNSVSPALRPLTTQSNSSSSKPVEIQSIRHVPRPDAQISPTFFMHQSMADILSQQEAEKTVVKEAVAKRSLQEIQQEQEFLSWWDGEARRLAEEEAEAVARATSEQAKGRGGDGPKKDRHRPGRGRGKTRETTGSQGAA